jgi:hypothetical protein
MNSQIDSSIPVLTEVITGTNPAINPAINPATHAATNTVANSEANTSDKPTPLAAISTAAQAAKSSEISVATAHEINLENSTLFTSQLSDEQLSNLENKLREDILSQVLQRVDFVLEHRIRDGLADVLQSAVDNLAGQIRAGLHVSLEELVRRSVNQELSKIKLSK